MNAERLLAHYEQFADTSDAIPHLRRFVLDLAIRGKLASQDINDQPVSELLSQISDEKKRLAITGKFKSLDLDYPCDDSQIPFSIPANWTWTYLDCIAVVARGGSPRPIKSYLTDDLDGIPWIKIGDSVRGNIYIDKTKERIRPVGLKKSRLVVPASCRKNASRSPFSPTFMGFPVPCGV